MPQNLKAQPRAAAVHNIAKKSSVAGSLGFAPYCGISDGNSLGSFDYAPHQYRHSLRFVAFVALRSRPQFLSCLCRHFVGTL